MAVAALSPSARGGLAAVAFRNRHGAAVRIQEEFGRIEAQSGGRLERPFDAIAVDLARLRARHEHVPVVIGAVGCRIQRGSRARAGRRPRGRRTADRRRRRLREDAEVDASGTRRGAQRMAPAGRCTGRPSRTQCRRPVVMRPLPARRRRFEILVRSLSHSKCRSRSMWRVARQRQFPSARPGAFIRPRCPGSEGPAGARSRARPETPRPAGSDAARHLESRPSGCRRYSQKMCLSRSGSSRTIRGWSRYRGFPCRPRCSGT